MFCMNEASLKSENENKIDAITSFWLNKHCYEKVAWIDGSNPLLPNTLFFFLPMSRCTGNSSDESSITKSKGSIRVHDRNNTLLKDPHQKDLT